MDQMKERSLFFPSSNSAMKICKVSSILKNKAKEFGKQNMFDGSEETCWQSHQGSPQFIIIEFNQPVSIHRIEIMFQGGFVGKDCSFFGMLSQNGKFEPSKESWIEMKLLDENFQVADNNSLQTMELKESSKLFQIQKFKIFWKSSTDFYGRIVVYKLDLIGIIHQEKE